MLRKSNEVEVKCMQFRAAVGDLVCEGIRATDVARSC